MAEIQYSQYHVIEQQKMPIKIDRKKVITFPTQDVKKWSRE